MKGKDIMKFCENCAVQLDDNAQFCHSCGTQVREVNIPQQQQQQGYEGSVGYEDQNSNQNDQYNQNEPTNTMPTDYNNQYQNNQQQYNQAPMQQKPPNKGTTWLIVSIIGTCCCSQLNIVTVIFAILSLTKYNAGDYEASENFARIAKILFFVFLVITVIISIILVATGWFQTLIDEYGYMYY